MKYPLSLRVLHWLMAAMILGLIAVGFYMAGIPSDAADKYALYPMHKAIGFMVLVLLLVRVPTRLRGKIPSAPEGLEKWEVNLSHVIHILLYVAMFTIAFSGYMMNSTFQYVDGLDLFGLFTVPDITEKSEYWNGVFHTVHSISAWVLSISLALHIAGALKHRFLDAPENDVLKRMV
jgi:cytochrome b561